MKHATALIAPLALIVLACANQTAPMGGPEDETPPILVRSSPDTNQRNFSGRNIELTFNEMLQLNNPKEEIIITPPVGKKTSFKLKDNRVLIEPELELKENTTYNINFREGIKDATEGNVPEDLRLAFSTGPHLDSLIIEGTIRDALAEEIPANITIAIYEPDTFNIAQHSPEYFAKSTKEGTFRLTNLKSGTYHVYAFNDKNKNLKLDSQSESFGLVSQPVVLDSATKVAIAMVRVDSRPFKLANVRTQATTNTIRLNKPAASYAIRSTPRVLSTYGSDQSEIIAHYPDIHPDTPVDSLLVSFTSVDSTEQHIDTSFYIKRDDREKIEETFRTTTTKPKFNAETNLFEFEIKFNKPLRAFTIDSLYIQSDTATVIPLNVANIKVDTVMNQLAYSETLQLKDSLIVPSLRIGKGFLVSIDGDSSRGESQTVDVATMATTATLLVEVQTKQPNYVVELVDSNNKVVASAVNTPNPVFKYLAPQSLRIRVVIDTNGNGKWDSANYLLNREPERIIYFLNSDRKSEIPLRANWEVGPNVIKF